MIGHEMIGQWISHLWQSTLFAVVVALVTLAFRKNRAQVRYGLWLSASVKFLVPFALLMNLGNSLWSAFAARQIATELAPPAVSLVVQQIAQPFTDSLSLVPSAPHSHTADWIPIAILGVWICGFLGVVFVRFRGWLRIRGAMRASTPIDVQAAAAVRSSPGLLEPGVVGVLRPILLLPEDISKRLSPSQLDAVLAHELSHIKRRDNLTAAIHMVVEAVFWFHPFVWWIGARLVEERERACDEAVLSLGGEPRDYADAIVNVCKLYVESPLTCVSGISGADLKKRIVRIMARHVGLRMSLGRKLLLGAAGVAALALPVLVGLVCAGRGLAQSKTDEAVAKLPEYEVVSIKPEKSGSSSMTQFRFPPDGLSINGFPLRMLLPEVFGVSNNQLLGEPGWADTDRFDIEAKVAAEDVPKLKSLTPNPRWAMLLPVLKDRFGLKFHRETRDLTQYVLVVSKGGLRMKQAVPGDTYANGMKSPDGKTGPEMMRGGKGELTAQAIPISVLVGYLSLQFGSQVVDKTGLTGKYDFDLKWVPDEMEGPMLRSPDSGHPDVDSPSPPAAGPSIFTAFEEQLGLKLESHKEPTDVIVIDHIEQPSPN